MTHAWCRDPSRDERVRAAEDGRDRPLPTLGECIDGMFPKSGSATSPVERENKGDGMRTERVTLEITHDGANGDPDDWPFDGVLGGEGWIGDGETVRVVPSGEADAEVERLRAEVACCRGLLESANKDRNAALARVAELEAIAKNYPDDLGVMRTTPELSERCNVLAARLVNLHLASLEIPPAETSATQETGLRTERVTLEVVHGAIASINDQRWWDNRLWIEPQKGESVRVVEEEERQAPPTTKPATTENDYVPPAPVSRPAETRQTKAERIGGGWWFPKYDKPSAPPPPPPAPPRVHRGSGVFDASGDEVPWEGVVAALTAERDAAIRERDKLRGEITSVLDRADQVRSEQDNLKARVAELEARTSTSGEGSCNAQAASGGGEGEPDAWGVRMKSGTYKGFLFPSREQANKCAELITDEVVAFFKTPPQPRGWLTNEERELIAGITDDDEYTEEGQNIAKGLLARSTPPEVVLDAFPTDETGESFSRRDVVAALAAAGVAVKEVGRE